MKKALILEKTTYTYPGTKKKVLSNVNATFDKGKMYAVMGKSGAGKTTLLSLVSGLDTATEGRVLYDGQDLSKLNRDHYRARSVGVIFQGYNLLNNATAIDNIVLSMNISGVKCKKKKAKAYELLANVGIDKETADRPILKLSGGEQQRVGIARALAHNPDVVIADEPSGNLDAETEKNIMQIFQDIAHNEDKCVIIVTHSKNVAECADEVWGLNKGNLTFVKEKYVFPHAHELEEKGATSKEPA
ncbi:MAG: ABC transporter ATP-binding protein [Clostridiales Family XIII bacterium]|jgi:putative ABC transport system ATP-binding protein|nr:ABC transporter ATP-binding protein [Clostridiales Family XIII bacterium]